MSLQSQYFKLTADEAALTVYDIIIVGAGFGGGTLAADLFVRNKRSGDSKKILVIESGNLLFHSHCSNAARPTAVGNADKQSIAFFKDFRGKYKNYESPQWEGGPLYALGGRSSVWTFYIPRPHDETLEKHFPSSVVKELNKTFFEKAESTLNMSFPQNPTVAHWNLVQELNKTAKGSEAWVNGRTASEFRHNKDSAFAAGAYSTVDRLLEIAMNDPQAEGNFKILLGTKVDRLEFQSSSIESVVLNGGIKIKTKHVVLCAGSVNSAAILLRSGVDIKALGGGMLTDHGMYEVVRTFKYSPHPTQEEVGPIRLQAYTNLGTDEHAALARIYVNWSTLGIRTHDLDAKPDFQLVFILTTKLGNENTIMLDEREPVIHIARTNDHDNATERQAMAEITNNAMNAMVKTLNVTFDDPTPLSSEFVAPLKLGVWAHELGSLPMPGPDPVPGDPVPPSVLDANLTLQGGYQGVSVCDNSVFPYSPSANPSLTLAALALRLSEFLMPRDNSQDAGTIGEIIEVV